MYEGAVDMLIHYSCDAYKFYLLLKFCRHKTRLFKSL
jgi:hypothetical protein